MVARSQLAAQNARRGHVEAKDQHLALSPGRVGHQHPGAIYHVASAHFGGRYQADEFAQSAEGIRGQAGRKLCCPHVLKTENGVRWDVVLGHYNRDSDVLDKRGLLRLADLKPDHPDEQQRGYGEENHFSTGHASSRPALIAMLSLSLIGTGPICEACHSHPTLVRTPWTRSLVPARLATPQAL